ncbi:NAD(P)/FAD-dependent oxidoreductase [Mucilaginibacter psychrotolerans]|uniref:FAD-dependent oxidoreductase n=1 Tax=Mucilaginibacter psychrotolerans TaxID=1524096 RepID=A0A4Y8S5P7_9SPHI|nr:FAD-dependent oxidoreductase [Mucilaginibacter psychrotolerans]TFF34323.1 FAD-dependent oxidoreductase [Mucilaginibacter psychrotolerans]
MSKTTIIGGGIIGLFSAYYLHKAGWEVEILEQGSLSDNASFGNAGMIVPSHFIPLAAPGMIEQGIRWMFDSKSPFYVKPSLNPELIGWGLKFLKAANKKHVERSAVALRDFSLLSKKLYQDFDKAAGFDFGLEDKGILMLYKTAKFEEEEHHTAEKARTLGLDAQNLTADEVRALQPDIDLDVLGAVLYHCDAHLYPNKLVAGLVKYLEAAGVKIHRNTTVTHIGHDYGKVVSVQSNDKSFKADKYLIAGGAWSPAIAKLAGLYVPLMPGKGYSFMVDEPQKRMSIPALLCEARVSVTPMNGNIRFGGTMEIGKVNDKINMNRVAGIVESIPKYFPGFKPAIPQVKDIWYGFRPCSPDGLPYIGTSAKYSNVAIATGHGMMGLSLAPATGKLIEEVLNEKQVSVNIDQFSPNRY